MNKKIGEDKYSFYWIFGTILSFVLYFSGIVWIYELLRRKVFGKYRNIVLTYHRIRDDAKQKNISVSIPNFKRQMEYLKDNFSVVSLETIFTKKEKIENTIHDNVAITFDDGYKDNYQNAYPIIKQYKFPAAIFIVAHPAGNDEMLSKEDMLIMGENGISFGSHTVSHPILTEIDFKTAMWEISESKAILEKMLGKKIYWFSYPKGKKKHFNEHLKAQVKKSGYIAAFTTENRDINLADDFYELGRIGIRNCPLFVFKTRLSGIFESSLAISIRKVFNLT